MEWRHLFTPLQIGPVTVKNRLGFAPNCPVGDGSLTTGVFGEDSVYYYAERAKGGQGLVYIGNTRVSKTTPYYPFADPQLFDDRNIPWIQRIAREVHGHDSRLFLQLFYTSWGRTTQPQQSGQYGDYYADLTIPAPSATSNAALGVHLREAGVEEMERINDEYAEAAARAVEGGVDGVEVSAHHLMLHAQFLTRAHNRRTDRYGGSMENRTRFLIELLNKVRGAIGDGVALGYRINSHYEIPGDLTVAEMQEIVEHVNARTKVDYISVSMGGPGVSQSSMSSPLGVRKPGYQMPFTAKIREVAAVPVFGVGSIVSPYQAEDALARGQCDLILMARQLFADPEFANKALEGRPDEIRPCVRIDYCATRPPFRPACFQNVAHGREKDWGIGTLKRAPEPRGVLVIGGGPAGMETARVVAERGHQVFLYEMTDGLGGRLRLQARLPHQDELGNSTAWFEHELRRLGVQVLLGGEVTPKNLGGILKEQAPDVVVVATGSRSAPGGFNVPLARQVEGWDSETVFTYEDVVAGGGPRGGKVIVFDDFSDELAPGLALLLAPDVDEVALVTPYASILSEPHTMPEHRDIQMERLIHGKNIRILTDTLVKDVRDSVVTLVNRVTREERVEEVVDGVVLLTHFKSNDSLFPLVKSQVPEAHLIGDALGYGPTHDAVLEGHRLGRAL